MKKAEAAEMAERLKHPKPKITKKRVEPTLDKKGRINENLYDLFPGMQSFVKNRKENTLEQYEKDQSVIEKVA